MFPEKFKSIGTICTCQCYCLSFYCNLCFVSMSQLSKISTDINELFAPELSIKFLVCE